MRRNLSILSKLALMASSLIGFEVWLAVNSEIYGAEDRHQVVSSTDNSKADSLGIPPEKSSFTYDSRHRWDPEFIYVRFVNMRDALKREQDLLSRDLALEEQMKTSPKLELPSDYMPSDQRKKIVEARSDITRDWALDLKDLLTGKVAVEIAPKRRAELLEAVRDYPMPPAGTIKFVR